MPRPIAQGSSYRFKVMVSSRRFGAIMSEVERHGLANKGATFNALLSRMDELIAGGQDWLGPVTAESGSSAVPVLLTCTVSNTQHTTIKRYIDGFPEPNKRLAFNAVLMEINAMLAGAPAKPHRQAKSERVAQTAEASNDESIHVKSDAAGKAEERSSAKKPPKRAFAAAMNLDLGALRAARGG